ncbi:MAG: SDR family oxidoreductase [Pseudobdellovibrionaceae bacterium]
MATGTTYDFTGKVALVTGGASGIGRATALAFGESNAWVGVADINEDRGLQTVFLIQQAGGEALFFKCDFSDPSSVQRMFKQIIQHMGKIDCAFNNAGIEGEQANTAKYSEDVWQKVIDVNLRGVWLCMKNEISSMLKSGGGTIVNCASVAGLVGFQNSSAYVASKHGVLGLTKTAALEFAKNNIRVNSVCPGVIETAMITRIMQEDSAALRKMVESEPIGRLGQPEEIAQAVLWLCSEQSSFVTGHSMVVDGGFTSY